MNQKLLKIFLFSAVFAVVVFSAHTVFARQLENDYPQIPLPGFGNYSLNEVFEAITQGTGPAAGDFKDKDPLSSLILYFYVLAVMVVGLVAFGALIIAGVKFLLSGASPGLRRDAKEQIIAAIIGIVILLGSWIILNTINPELRILHRVGQGTSTPAGIDLGDWKPQEATFDAFVDQDTLWYGGIVLYRHNALSAKAPNFMAGGTKRSETVLNDIKNFSNGSWVGNDTATGMRILGKCTITLFKDADYGGPSWPFTGPAHLAPLSPGSGEASSIKINNGDCMGDSITVYETEQFKDGALPAIYGMADLDNDVFRKEGPVTIKDANDDIDAIQFASSTRYNSESGSKDLVIGVCKNAEWQDCAGGITKHIPKMDDEEQLKNDKSWNDTVSSFALAGTGENRQAGVVLYNLEGFNGVSEIFITSDEKLNGAATDSNIVSVDQTDRPLGGSSVKINDKEWVSSLRIIGEYVVTLYDEELFGGNYVRFSNTRDAQGYEYGVAGLPGPNRFTSLERTNGILAVPKLSEFPYPRTNIDPPPTKTWDEDKIKSIQLWIPKKIDDEQELLPPGACGGGIYCIL